MNRYVLAAGILLAATQFSSAATTVPVAGASQRFITLGDEAQLSSTVVGLDVYNNKDDIGTIKDVAFDTTGVRAYILSVGGFLGMGTHYVAVTPSEIQVMYNATDKKWHANMSATKDELKAAPEFTYTGKWNASQT